MIMVAAGVLLAGCSSAPTTGVAPNDIGVGRFSYSYAPDGTLMSSATYETATDCNSNVRAAYKSVAPGFSVRCSDQDLAEKLPAVIVYVKKRYPSAPVSMRYPRVDWCENFYNAASPERKSFMANHCRDGLTQIK
jgi:hypothetical protein